MMRVAIVTPYDWSVPGGVRSHIEGQAAALRRAGDEVTVMAPASGPTVGIERLGPVLPIPANGSIARVCLDPRAVLKLRRMLRSGFDLVHVHEPAVPMVSLGAVMVAGLPLVGTFHASAERSLLYSAAGPALRMALARIEERIAVSAAAQRLAAAHLGGTYSIIPNAVEVSRWRSAPATELGERRPYVLFVGRPEPRKGLEVAVAAMEQVRAKRDVDLVAVGPSAEQVPEWVVTTGPLGQAQLAAAYAGAEVFVASSLGGESFGIVLIEAMSAGTPVVCSDIPGYADAAGGAAVLVSPGDAAALAQAVERVLDDHALRERLRRTGADRANEFDWDVVVHKVRDTYGRALS